MPQIEFVMEKVSQQDPLTTAEAKVLGREVTRLLGRLASCAEEVRRRDEADKAKRKKEIEIVERSRALDAEVTRLRDAFNHEKQQRVTDTGDLAERVKFLEEILRDVHFGLMHQAVLTREQIAGTIASVVDPHPPPLG